MVEEIYRSPRWLNFVVKVVKAPLLELLNKLDDHLPAPTKENMRGCNPNTFVLIELRDEFFQLEKQDPPRIKAFRAVWNFVIFLYGYDNYYRHRLDWVVERWQTKTWQPREAYRPREHCWREWDNLSREERRRMQQGMGRS